MNGERRETMHDKLARVAQLNIGYQIPPATTRTGRPSPRSAQILGGGESSRLYQSLVKEKELCSSIGSGAGSARGTGLLHDHLLGPPGQEHRGSRVRRSPKRSPSCTRLAGDRRRNCSACAPRRAAAPSASGKALSAAPERWPTTPPSTTIRTGINTRPDKLSSVTAADVQRVATAYLADQQPRRRCTRCRRATRRPRDSRKPETRQ